MVGRSKFLGSKYIDIVWESILNQITREPVHRPAEKHMIFRTVSIHDFTTSIRTIALGHPKSALEPF